MTPDTTTYNKWLDNQSFNGKNGSEKNSRANSVYKSLLDKIFRLLNDI